MATSVMRIQVATLGGVPDGESRNDGQSGLLVTVTSVGTGTNHTLNIWNTTDTSPPTLINTGPTTWEFTPVNGSNTYDLELAVDDGSPASEVISRRTYRIPTENYGFLLPAPNEGADPDASLQNNGPAVVEASHDNASGNYLGWALRAEAFLRQVDTHRRGVSLIDNDSLSYRLIEGTNLYLGINTTNAAETMTFGGTSNPSFVFSGTGSVSFGGGVGTAGQVLTSNGAGVAPTWQAAFGGNTLDDAYDQGGAGAGRTITADSGAVEIAGTGGLHISGAGPLNFDGTNIDLDPTGTYALNMAASQTATITVAATLANAFLIQQSTNAFYAIDTSGNTITHGGATNPTHVFTGTGPVSFGGGVGSAGQILTSNGAGVAPTWQASASGNTLDAAYDQGGAGAGRVITADTGDVEIAGGFGLDVSGTGGIEVSGLGPFVFSGTIFDLNPASNFTCDMVTAATVTWGIGTVASAFRIHDGGVDYFNINTGVGTEVMTFGNGTTGPDYVFSGAGTVSFGGGIGSAGQVLTSNGAGAAPTWQATSGGNTLDQAYDQGGAGAGRTITADSGAVEIASTGGLHISGLGPFNFDGAAFDLDPNGNFTCDMTATATVTFGLGTVASAFRIHDGGVDYLDITTTGASEAMTFGNGTTNPDYTFSGSGTVSFGGGIGSAGQVLTSNGAGAAPTWQAASGGLPHTVSTNATTVILSEGTTGTYLATDDSTGTEYLNLVPNDTRRVVEIGTVGGIANVDPFIGWNGGTGAATVRATMQYDGSVNRMIHRLDTSGSLGGFFFYMPPFDTLALRVCDTGSINYIVVDTNGEIINLGNTSYNPALNLLGTGATTLGGVLNVAGLTTTFNSDATTAAENPVLQLLGGDGTSLHTGSITFQYGSVGGGNRFIFDSDVFTASQSHILQVGNQTRIAASQSAIYFYCGSGAAVRNKIEYLDSGGNFWNTTATLEIFTHPVRFQGTATSQIAGTYAFSGSTFDLDPTGTFTLDMDAGQAVTITVADDLSNAWLVKEGASNTYLGVTTANGAETVVVGNSTTNPQIAFVGSGEFSLTGSVDWDPTGSIAIDMDGSQNVTINGASSSSWIQNMFSVGEDRSWSSMTFGAGNTTVTTAGTPVKAANTTGLSANSNNFDDDSATNNRMRYTGSFTRLAMVIFTGSLEAVSVSAGGNFQVHIAENGTPVAVTNVYLDGTANRDAPVSVSALISFSTNDYVEIYVDAVTNGDQVLVEDGTLWAVMLE